MENEWILIYEMIIYLNWGWKIEIYEGHRSDYISTAVDHFIY